MPTPVEEPERVPDKISITIVRVGENMGDHGETTFTAIDVDENLTIRQLMEAVMPQTRWLQRQYAHRVELKFAQPIVVEEPPASEDFERMFR